MRSIRVALFLLPLSLLAIGAHAQQGRLLVAIKGEGSLGIVDPVTGKVLVSVPEGGFTGHEVTASPDGRLAYVPIYGNSGVGKPGTDGTKMVVVDLASAKVVGEVDFGHGVRPHLPVFDAKDGMLYVSTELDQRISIIDPKTLKIVGSVPTGQEQSHMFTISHDGRRAYTANVGPGTVSVLDMPARKVLKIIPVSAETQRISISNDDKWVFTADQKQPRMAVIDTSTDSIAKWVPLDGFGYGSVPTGNGRWLLMTIPAMNEIQVVDLKTMQVVRSVPTPADPEEVIVQPDGKAAWVSFPKSNQVAEIDLATWKVVRQVPTGKNSDGLAWAGQ